MKRLLSLLLLLLVPGFLGAQGSLQTGLPEPEDPEVQVFIARQGRGRAQQGMEMYGKYILSCEDGGHVNVYNYRKADPVPIAQFDLASSRKDNHANNAEFGVEKARGGSFPLLYISNGKVGSDIEWICFVESVSKRWGKWKSTLVQKIILDGCDGWEGNGYTAIFGAPSWLVDRERGFLWVFSAIKRTTPQVTKVFSENLYVATKFRIPKLSEGPEVHLGLADILDQKTFPFDIGFTQAGCMHDGLLYYCYGVGNKDESRPAGIRVYDTDSGKIAARYNLKEIVLQEPEDIVIRDGWLFLNANTPSKSGILPNIYKISLPKR